MHRDVRDLLGLLALPLELWRALTGPGVTDDVGARLQVEAFGRTGIRNHVRRIAIGEE